MRVVPGTHKREVVPHQDTFGEHNMLSRGQEIAVEVDEDHAVDLVLQPGQMSLHHVKMFHGSRQNRARRPADRLRDPLPAAARSTSRSAPTARRWCAARTATAISSTSRRRRATSTPQAVALHQALRERRTAILMRGAAQTSKAAHTAASSSAM